MKEEESSVVCEEEDMGERVLSITLGFEKMGRKNWLVYGWKRDTSFITQKGRRRRCLNSGKFVDLVA